MSILSPNPTRVLILTASMGEGHNTAAKNIRNAILTQFGSNAEVLVVDPYTRTNPVVNSLMQQGYSLAINNYPRVWKLVFEMLSKPGMIEGMGPLLTQLINAVHGLVHEFKPHVIASTYPVFGYILAKIRKTDPSVNAPFFTVITDSTIINSAWYRYPSDGAIVADDPSASVLINDGVRKDKVHTLGFPVGIEFEDFIPTPPPHDGIWKLLFFPGGTPRRAMETLHHLSTLPNAKITIVTGRRQAIHDIISRAGVHQRCNLIGWTDKMPELMGSHHIFIGKAGGATVQEAIAAQIPFVVSHVVPGQEEGNIALIQQTGIGTLAAANPDHVLHVIKGAMANEGALWRTWRKNLVHLQKPSASQRIAKFLMEHAMN